MHAIRVNWFEKGGEEVLTRLGWSWNQVGGIDKAIVMTPDGKSCRAVTEKVDPINLYTTPIWSIREKTVCLARLFLVSRKEGKWQVITNGA